MQLPTLAKTYRVAFTRDGADVLTVGADGVLRRIDAVTGGELARIAPLDMLPVGRLTSIDALAVSPDGKVAAVGYGDGSIQLLTLEGRGMKELGPRIREAGDTKTVQSLAFSVDGRLLGVAGSAGGTRVLDLETRAVTVRIPSQGEVVVRSVALLPDGRIVTGSQDGTMKLWSADGGRCDAVFAGHFEAITAIAVSSDGWQIATTSADHTVRVWDVVTAKEVSPPGARHLWIDELEVLADGHVMTTSRVGPCRSSARIRARRSRPSSPTASPRSP